MFLPPTVSPSSSAPPDRPTTRSAAFTLARTDPPAASAHAAPVAAPLVAGACTKSWSRGKCLRELEICSQSINGLLDLLADPDVQADLTSSDRMVRRDTKEMIRDQIADVRRDVQETLKNCRSVLNAEEIGDLEEMLGDLDDMERDHLSRFDHPDEAERKKALQAFKRDVAALGQDFLDFGKAIYGAAVMMVGAFWKIAQLVWSLSR